jgi:hypothetical protein
MVAGMTQLLDRGQFVWPTPAQAGPEFRVVVLYDTFERGAAAMKVCENLIQQFERSLMFQITIEDFGALEEEGHFDKALSRGADADMIFVASEGRLPNVVLRWLDQCLEQRDPCSPAALAELTASDNPYASEVNRLLRDLALENHLDLISHSTASRYCAPAASVPVLPAVSFTASSGGNIRHWGINE